MAHVTLCDICCQTIGKDDDSLDIKYRCKNGMFNKYLNISVHPKCLNKMLRDKTLIDIVKELTE